MQKELPFWDFCLWLTVEKKKELLTSAAQGAFVPFKSQIVGWFKRCRISSKEISSDIGVNKLDMRNI